MQRQLGITFACRFCALLFTLSSSVLAQDNPPATVIWDGSYLASLRATAVDGRPPDVAAALDRVRDQARAALLHSVYSVTFKKTLPPSGNRHDYQSFSRYWWPNPDTADGLPYVRRDGQVNRKLLSQGDRVPLGSLVDDVQALSLAYYYLDDQRAGEKAVEMVNTWFLVPDTRMNPHLSYGQSVPGRSDGRGPGIIDTRGFMLVIDSVELLDNSVGWTAARHAALKRWFKDYGHWLRTSKIGGDERRAKNNHGSWYDAQVARYAVFAEDYDIAQDTLNAVKQRRISKQFQADGMQPEALKRTLSLHYSMFNLTALVCAARVGEHPQVNVDLWSYVPDRGCGIRCAYQTLLPYICGEKTWEHRQIKPFKVSRSARLALRFAAHEYGNPAFHQVGQSTPVSHGESDFTPLLAAGLAAHKD